MRTERQKMLDGEQYDPLDPELVAARVQARELCQTLNAFFCDYGSNVELGERVLQLQLHRARRVPRRDRELLAVRAGGPDLYADASDECRARRRHEFGKPVEIGSDVWVGGGGAIILPGVRIGSRAVIGAGSVVTRDVPEDMFAAGNPCRVVRELMD